MLHRNTRTRPATRRVRARHAASGAQALLWAVPAITVCALAYIVLAPVATALGQALVTLATVPTP